MTSHPDAATSDAVAMRANAWRSILELGRLAPTPHPQDGHGDRERVGVVGLAAAAATQRADPGRQRRRHVEDGSLS
jgi:hypothetical protein